MIREKLRDAEKGANHAASGDYAKYTLEKEESF